jgi:hypothetical protein
METDLTDLLAQIKQASTPEEKKWLILQNTIPEDLLEDAMSVAAFHWFDQDIARALNISSYDKLREAIAEDISVTANDHDNTRTIHDTIRKALLQQLRKGNPEKFKDVSKIAAKYFANSGSKSDKIEEIYHLAAFDLQEAKNQLEMTIDTKPPLYKLELLRTVLSERLELGVIEDRSLLESIEKCISEQPPKILCPVEWFFYLESTQKKDEKELNLLLRFNPLPPFHNNEVKHEVKLRGGEMKIILNNKVEIISTNNPRIKVKDQDSLLDVEIEYSPSKHQFICALKEEDNSASSFRGMTDPITLCKISRDNREIDIINIVFGIKSKNLLWLPEASSVIYSEAESSRKAVTEAESSREAVKNIANYNDYIKGIYKNDKEIIKESKSAILARQNNLHLLMQ